jgi:hypothetical protein
MGRFRYGAVVGTLRHLERKAKALPKPEPPPDPADGELIPESMTRSHYLEFTLRWGGMWLVAMTFMFLRMVVVFAQTGLGTPGVIIAGGFCAWFIVYLWRMALVARKWVRITALYDLQAADRRLLKTRQRELDDREQAMLVKEAALEDREARLHEDRVRVAAAKRQATAKERAEQAADLVQIAKELEGGDERGGPRES